MQTMNPDQAHAAQNPNFGARLTQSEYEDRIFALYSAGPPMPTFEQMAKRSQVELELLIDYHLGIEFPVARRQALWQAKRKFESRRGWYLILGVLTNPADPGAGPARGLARSLSKVLSFDELRAFLDMSAEDLKRLV